MTSDSKQQFEEQQKTIVKLLAELECPVCFETSVPPIFMCKNGHNICVKCRQQVIECPTCREPGMPDNRNLFAETASLQFTVGCKFKEAGCKNVVIKPKLPAHELDCDFRYLCFVCTEHRGDLPSLHKHFATKHSAQYVDSNVWDGHVKMPSRTFRYLSCFGVSFRCGLGACENGLFLYTKYFGPREDADKFKCWFKFVSADGEFKCSYKVQCQDTADMFYFKDMVIVSNEIFNKLKTSDGSVHCVINI